MTSLRALDSTSLAARSVRRLSAPRPMRSLKGQFVTAELNRSRTFAMPSPRRFATFKRTLAVNCFGASSFRVRMSTPVNCPPSWPVSGYALGMNFCNMEGRREML